MKIEVHLLQNFPPSCLNRDDTNTPKDCEFGGVRRARISSQCIKRSIRSYFREHNTVEVGERTKRLRGELIKQLPDLPADQLPDALDAFLEAYYSKLDSKQPGNTAVLLFVSPAEIQEAAACVREIWDELNQVGQERRAKIYEATAKKARKSAKNNDTQNADADTSATESEADAKGLPKPKARKDIQERLEHAALSPDIALFGRMLAEQLGMRVEASCQVAHAISTHKVDLEMDFFTAVDDLNTDDAGAGMLGVTGFNSACFYRYALIDRPQLIENLGDAASADRAIRAFLQAAVKAIPTGKQNSMAAQNPPSFGLFVVRESGAPASLANAFVQPIPTGKDDKNLVEQSIHCLTQYFDRLNTVYGNEGVVAQKVFCIEGADQLNGLTLKRVESLQDAIDQTMNAVSNASSESEMAAGVTP